MAIEDWHSAGVRFLDKQSSLELGPALLLLPAGKEGPALLASENCNVLRSYNRAAAYVIAAGDLSDRIAEGPESEPNGLLPDIICRNKKSRRFSARWWRADMKRAE